MAVAQIRINRLNSIEKKENIMRSKPIGKCWSALCAMIVAVGLTACGSSSAGSSKGVYTIRINEAFKSLLYLPLYVAQDKGFLGKNNIKIDGEIGNSGTGGVALTAVLHGDADFALGGPENTAYMNAKGGQTVSVAAAANSAPAWVVSKDGTALNSMADLKGSSIAVSTPGTTTNTLLKEGLQQAGLSYNGDVKAQEVQQGSEISSVITGHTDYAVANEPYISQGVQKGLKIVYDWTKVYPEYAYSTFMTSRNFVKNNPDLVQHFVDAINQSLQYIHAHPEETVAVAQHRFPQLDKTVVADAVHRMIAANVYPKSALITPKAVQVAMQRQVNAGNLKVLPRYDDLIDPSFAKKAE
jgi:NitT/TauT family transport system substrate-binding protein